MDEPPEEILVVSNEGLEKRLKCKDLRDQSDYFRALFDSGMKEVQEGRVVLPTISDEALQYVSKFVKQEELDLPHATLSTVDVIIEGATYLHMPGLNKVCENRLLQALTSDNCDEVEEIADHHSWQSLKQTVRAFRNNHIQDYVRSAQFEHLGFEEMCALLSSSHINIASELQVWKFIITWLKGNEEEVDRVFNSSDNYESACVKLLHVLRFPCIAEDKSALDNNSMLVLQQVFTQQTLDTFLKLYIKQTRFATKYHSNATMYHKHMMEPNTQLEIRNPHDVIVTVGGFTSKECASKSMCTLPLLDLVNAQSKKSEESAEQASEEQSDSSGRETASVGQDSASSAQDSASPVREAPMHSLRPLGVRVAARNSVTFKAQTKVKLPTNLCENGMCVVDGIIYIAGGQVKYNEDGRHTTNAVHRFDPWRCQWSQACSLRVKRSLFYMGELGGKLYAVCGWLEPNKVTRTVEVYDPKTDRWAFCAHLEDRPHEHAGCSHNGAMYISGGFKGPQRGHLDKLWRYDVEEDTWTTLAPMNSGRSYHSMASVRDYILVAGGVNYRNHYGHDSFVDVHSCELYDPATNQWSVVSQNALPASCQSSLFHGNKLYLFGGHSFQDDSDHDVIQVLDTTTWQWHLLDMAGHKANYFTCAVVSLPRHML